MRSSESKDVYAYSGVDDDYEDEIYPPYVPPVPRKEGEFDPFADF